MVRRNWHLDFLNRLCLRVVPYCVTTVEQVRMDLTVANNDVCPALLSREHVVKTEQPTCQQAISVAIILYVCRREVLRWATLLGEDFRWPISYLCWYTVQRFQPLFPFFNFLLLQEDLVRSGYKTNKEVENPIACWQTFRTYYYLAWGIWKLKICPYPPKKYWQFHNFLLP
jgi:hypothetical protein